MRFSREALLGLPSKSPGSPKAYDPLPRDEQVIVDHNPQRPGGRHEMACHLLVSPRWPWPAGRMVVREDDRGRAQLDTPFQDLARIDVDPVYCSRGQYFVRQQVVGGIEEQDAGLLDWCECHRVAQIIENRLLFGQDRPGGHASAQDMIERTIHPAQHPLDLFGVFEQTCALSFRCGHHRAERSEPCEQPVGKLARAIRRGHRDQLFQGASAPSRDNRS